MTVTANPFSALITPVEGTEATKITWPGWKMYDLAVVIFTEQMKLLLRGDERVNVKVEEFCGIKDTTIALQVPKSRILWMTRWHTIARITIEADYEDFCITAIAPHNRSSAVFRIAQTVHNQMRQLTASYTFSPTLKSGDPYLGINND